MFGRPVSALFTDKHVAFLTDLWTHNASYLGGLIGGIWLMASVWRWRMRAITAAS